ncbi:hypothetical protein [Deinococcus psychrotolerans]|uniref:hypothetical protein n=1 Tax=Deinococcus psychrotolerans TaxID=2489213 RepID=UPI0030B988E0
MYKGRNKTLGTIQVGDLRQRVEKGESKASLNRDFGIGRETVYPYLNAAARTQTLGPVMFACITDPQSSPPRARTVRRGCWRS